MSKKLYNETGLLSKYGEIVTLPVKNALRNLLNQDEHIKDMDESELRVLGGSLQKIVGDLISDRIQQKKQIAQEFAAMDDEEFYSYLKGKYGDNWRLVSLTSEELGRCPHLSKEEIKKSLEEGRKAAAEYYNNIPPIRVTNLRIK